MSQRARRVRIGYMRVREIKGVMRIWVEPLDREEALRLLRGHAGEGKGRD